MKANKEYFKIRSDYGRLYARDVLDYYLTADELQSVIDRLQQTHDLMTITDQGQREIYLADVERMTESSEIGMKVHYPFNQPYGVFQKENMLLGMRRSPKEHRFVGVYVIAIDQMPGKVKIGCTTDLYQRTRQLRHDIGTAFNIHNPHFESIAFIDTNQPGTVETMLHRKFVEFKLHGEWFQRSPVEDWLEQFRSAS